jgi:hypothetical protein
MFWHGKIGLLAILLLLAMGMVFVGGSVYLYGQMWAEDD